jgi:hypothetical protein
VLTGDPGLVTGGYDPRFDDNEATPNGTLPRDQFSDPRADILMFFTNRPLVSRAPAISPNSNDLFQLSLQRGVKASPSQIVYGHAALDTAVRNGNTWTFADVLQHIERADGDAAALSPLSATRWHLARRATIINDLGLGGLSSLGAPRFQGKAVDQGNANEFPRILRCRSDDNRLAADAVDFRLQRYLQWFSPDWWGTGNPLALRNPYGLGMFGLPQRWSNSDLLAVEDILYPNNTQSRAYNHVATVVEQPPAALQDNLGVHLLPGCVWFQVEFLLPEDPRNGLDSPLSDQRRDTPRWVAVEPEQTYVFVPDTEANRALVQSDAFVVPINLNARVRSFMHVVPTNTDFTGYNGQDTVDNRRVRMWPYAIRVTVRVFDQRGRLDQPIVQSVVHRFD